jgi:cytoskeleton protein RodZ
MRTIGDRLRAEREKRGITIAKIAAELRINPQYLQAIEDGDPDRLPGGFFYRAFVRQYARYLKVDEDEIERELEALRPPQPSAEQPEPFPVEVPPEPPSRFADALNRLPLSLIALALVLAGGAAVYSIWFQNRTTAEPSREASLPSPPASPAPPPSAPPPQEPAPAQPQPSSAPLAASTAGPPASPPVAPAYLPPPQGVTPVASAPPEAQGARFSVLLSAKEDVWVSLASAGKTLVLGILKPGEQRRVEAAGSAKLVVGNAGGIEVLVNERPIGPIGPRGFPRTVLLSPEGGQVLPPKPPAQPPSEPPTV